MSSYHVLTVNEREKRAQVAFHIPIPDEDNSAPTPVNLREALQQHLSSVSEGGTITSQVPWISTELANIQSGELYEYVEEVVFNAGNDSNAEKKAVIDARYTALTTIVVNRIRSILKYWGMDVDIS